MNPSSTAQPSCQNKQLQTKIVELAGKKHLPAEMVALVSTVAELQIDSFSRVVFNDGRESLGTTALQKISPREQRHSGLPILPAKDFPLDLPFMAELAKTFLKILPEKVPALAVHASELAARLDDPGLFEAACREILAPPLLEQTPPLFDAWEKNHPEAPHFFRFIVTSAATPALAAVGRVLGEEHGNDSVWPHGHCPVCGSQPLIGRLVDKEGRRMHSCSFCAFEYRTPRMGCPFCLAPESEGSEYHVSEDEPGYLLTSCKTCNCYFKLGDFRENDRPWFPLLDDLSSLTLDLYAMQMGYMRPTLSGWGF